MNGQTYAAYLRSAYGLVEEGPLTDFVTRRDGRLLLGDQVDLGALVERYGAPLEVVYLPQIQTQVRRMRQWAIDASTSTGYAGRFLYAYATKANFSAEVVHTALTAGAHYETSAAADVQIAGRLWRQGILPADRYIFCNGSKEPDYLNGILALRAAGCSGVLPIVDDLDELDTLLASHAPLRLGVRVRGPHLRHPGANRFGLTPEEIQVARERIARTHHRLVMYHAMMGSQLTDADAWLAELRGAVVEYCRLKQQVPSLRMLNIGGGFPTSGYDLGFRFDYQAFLTRLMDIIRQICTAHGVTEPDLVGEFGRYTVATHSVYLFEVGQVKAGHADGPAWYLVNGSLMVAIPDSLLVAGQQFVTLALEGWDEPVRAARLAGRRTCDSDDVYPPPSLPPLMLPAGGHGQVVAIFGVGAYQQMISGKGGAHHCLSPEPRRIIIEAIEGVLRYRDVPTQNIDMLLALLGYAPHMLPEPLDLPVPVRHEERVAV